MSNQEPGLKNSAGLSVILRSLGSRNYRLFFAGQGISLIGTWMQNIALSWLVYRLTNSVFLLGVVNFAGDIPSFFVMPFAGVLADRWNRRRILVITQTLAMAQAFILSILVLTGKVQVWHLVALAMFLGVVNAFDMPTRQSFVVEMIEKKEDLINAISLNSTIFNGARLVGPSIAGLLIAAVGEGWCFLINGFSFLAVIAALLAMRVNERPIPEKDYDTLRGLKQGLTYAYNHTPIKSVLLLLVLTGLVGMPYVVLMPVMAKDILRGGPYTLGFLMGATGLGALISALRMASRPDAKGLERYIPLSAALFGTGLIAISFSRFFPLSLVLMLAAGFGLMTQFTCSNTLIQTLVDDDKRGRVMSLYTMAFRGIAPFGSLLAGAMASKIGAPHTLLIGGAACILGAFLFARNLPAIRAAIHPRAKSI